MDESGMLFAENLFINFPIQQIKFYEKALNSAIDV